MNFWRSVDTCLLQKYFTFDGTASRSEYWNFFLFTIIANIFSKFIAVLLSTSMGPSVGLVALFLVPLAFLIPSLAVHVRRLHDVGRSGFWVVSPWILLFLSTLLSEQPELNQYIGHILPSVDHPISLAGALGFFVLIFANFIFTLLPSKSSGMHNSGALNTKAPTEVVQERAEINQDTATVRSRPIIRAGVYLNDEFAFRIYSSGRVWVTRADLEPLDGAGPDFKSIGWFLRAYPDIDLSSIRRVED
jgi:uncharacterized membrane protein YhaH (DUF805 family)